MSNLVFVSGDFCSGSTLLFTLFRKTGQFYSLYEPLHELLLEYLIWPMLPDDHHFFIETYHTELKGFDNIPVLFDPRWGNSGLYMDARADDDYMYRYLSYLIGTAFGRCAKVMIKENRLTFRLAWLKAKFPHAKIVHIYRNKEDEWRSILRRVRTHLRREDVGQDNVHFNGFAIDLWCEDLKAQFPELDARNFDTGYERFCKLWELSLAEHEKYADVSIDYWSLTHDFENACERIWSCIGATGVDTVSLKQFVIPSERQETSGGASKLTREIIQLVDRTGRRYSKARLRVRQLVNRGGPS